MNFTAPIKVELESAFKGLLLSEEVQLGDALAKWKEFADKLAAGPCGLTPADFSLQLAISRHLLELIGDAVSEDARKALNESIAASDEVFRKASQELAKPLADEGGEPLWYLVRGPLALTPEAHPELWDFYFGKGATFEGPDLEELDTVAREVCDDDHASFEELFQFWKELVVNIETGYDNVPEEYENDVWQSRGNLEQIAMALTSPLRTPLVAALEPWDERFKTATRDTEIESEDDEESEEPSFLHRIPRRFRLNDEEQQEWMEL